MRVWWPLGTLLVNSGGEGGVEPGEVGGAGAVEGLAGPVGIEPIMLIVVAAMVCSRVVFGKPR